MKKSVFTIMLAMTIIGGIFTSCNKENDNKPTEKEYTVKYILRDHDLQNVYVSECFTYDFTYTGADNNAVKVDGVKAGWEMEIKVKAPFIAKIEGKIKYNESELPEENIHFSHTLANILHSGYYTNNMSISVFSTKEKFLDYINKHPEKLNFSETDTIR